MRFRCSAVRVCVILAAAMLAGASTARGQGSGGTSNGMGGNGVAGVGIDASRLLKCFVDENGVLQKVVMGDPSGRLSEQKRAAGRRAHNAVLGKKSPLRKISLNRLEQAVAAGGGRPSEEMRYLAGLSKIQYVFFYPDSGDI